MYREVSYRTDKQDQIILNVKIPDNALAVSPNLNLNDHDQTGWVGDTYWRARRDVIEFRKNGRGVFVKVRNMRIFIYQTSCLA
jgi:hypothetical protein